MSCLSIFSASAFGIISFVTKAEKEICASAKAAIVDPAACSGLLKSSSSVIEQLLCRLVFAPLGNPKFRLSLPRCARLGHGPYDFLFVDGSKICGPARRELLILEASICAGCRQSGLRSGGRKKPNEFLPRLRRRGATHHGGCIDEIALQVVR